MIVDALRFSNYDVVFQEVPGEVTLAINITGCPHRCPGCHSAYLQEYFGELLLENLDAIISKYDGLITCVSFMGGDQNIKEIESALKIVKAHNLKTCVYFGAETVAEVQPIVHLLDFFKTGSYMAKFGGLNSPTTNQRFFKVVGSEIVNQTHLFRNPQNQHL